LVSYNKETCLFLI